MNGLWMLSIWICEAIITGLFTFHLNFNTTPVLLKFKFTIRQQDSLLKTSLNIDKYSIEGYKNTLLQINMVSRSVICYSDVITQCNEPQKHSVASQIFYSLKSLFRSNNAPLISTLLHTEIRLFCTLPRQLTSILW